MAGPQVVGQGTHTQGDAPGDGSVATETANLGAVALAACADQYDTFLNETARDYRKLWADLRACEAPDRALYAWQQFWMGRSAAYLGAAFRAAAAPTVDVELAALGIATHRSPI